MFNLTPWKKRSASTMQPLGAEAGEGRLGPLWREFDGLVNRFREGLPALEQQWLPEGFGWKIDLEENDQEYVYRAEAPGFEAGDFQVDLQGKVLTISAEHKEETEEEGTGKVSRYGRFRRIATLPPGADAEKLSARYHSGVLEIHMPKEPALQGKRISVQAK